MSDLKVPRVIVGALLFDSLGRLFLMQSSGKFGDQWIVPGGKVDFGETLIDGLQREIREETNLAIKEVRLLGVRELIEPSRHFVFHEFAAVAENPDDVSLNNEATHHRWFTKDQIQDIHVAPSTLDLLRQHWL